MEMSKAIVEDKATKEIAAKLTTPFISSTFIERISFEKSI
jgi:hypothetical protein